MAIGKAALVALAFGMAAVASPGTAMGAAQVPFMQTGDETSQPVGHYEFCKRNGAECQIHSVDLSAAKVTLAVWDRIRTVNDRVNRAVKPLTDQEQYGQQELWTYPQGAGDCEDYALEKRRELQRAGFPVTDLLITVVRKPDGTGHAVLTVRTTKGDYILDNLDDQVLPWSQTPYHYLKRQASYDTGRWVTIENCADDVLVGAIQK